MTRSARFVLPLVIAACVVPALSCAARLPHLKLKAIFPGKDTTLTTSPDAVKLWLS